jgi:hypothetical protein
MYWQLETLFELKTRLEVVNFVETKLKINKIGRVNFVERKKKNREA